MKESDLIPKGGPNGYLYNLNEGLKSINNDKVDIFFLPEENSIRQTKKRRIKERLKKNEIVKILINYRFYKKVFSGTKKDNFRFSDYDLLHFHTTIDLYRNRHLLLDFKGKILLTSHSPQPSFKEIREYHLNSLEKKLFKKFYEKLESIDMYAFERATYVIFPCQQAEEPYYNQWDFYNRISNSKKLYMLTGVKDIVVREKDEDIRNKYNIPKNSFVVTYVGRHNSVKGYDLLKEYGAAILESNANVYFLIAGNESPIKGLKHDRWIEVGWTNDPYSIINSSNIFILPNRETYFDIIMLEVLSIGKPIIASATGGNKYFENGHGVLLYKNQKEFEKQFSKFYNSSAEDLKFLELKNKELFAEEFTHVKFANRYIAIIEKIYDGIV